MGKAGRIACITIPWALTVASLICLILIEVSGWSKSASLGQYYFIQANFTGLDVSSAGDVANSTTLTAALELAQQDDLLRDIYQIHLWNYCTSNSSDGEIDYCSDRHKNYYFDILAVWGLNATSTSSSSTATSSDNAVESVLADAEDNVEDLEQEVLGKSGKEALDAYKKVSKWMFIAYEVSFWTTLATLACGLLAIWSRIGSLLTWVLSIVSTLFTFAAVLTSTLLFTLLTAALKTLLDPYNITLHLGHPALAITWLAVFFSLTATLFWLFSTCCCSGRSNPHHRTNKGGLWDAEPKGMGYEGRGRGLRVEKTGGGAYERVASPGLGFAGEGDRVPLQQYPGHVQQPYAPSGGFEPYRHS